MKINRRSFIKGLASIVVFPSIVSNPFLSGLGFKPKVIKNEFEGINISYLGEKFLNDSRKNIYPVYAYKLNKGELETYVFIDKELMDASPNKQEYIINELEYRAKYMQKKYREKYYV